ncbi:hypothetical protein JMUB6875_28670 [Nocardia sp. JMUB6875]
MWISGPQFDAWRHTQLVLDAVPGRGAGFSLEAPEGMRFLTRGRVFAPAERSALEASEPTTGAAWEQGHRPTLTATEPQVVAHAIDACPIPGRT